MLVFFSISPSCISNKKLLTFSVEYDRISTSHDKTVGGYPLAQCERDIFSFPSCFTRGGDYMITYPELFQFVVMLIQIITLCVMIFHEKKK